MPLRWSRLIAIAPYSSARWRVSVAIRNVVTSRLPSNIPIWTTVLPMSMVSSIPLITPRRGKLYGTAIFRAMTLLLLRLVVRHAHHERNTPFVVSMSNHDRVVEYNRLTTALEDRDATSLGAMAFRQRHYWAVDLYAIP